MCAPVWGNGRVDPHTGRCWKTAPSAPACPFMRDTDTAPNWGPPALQSGHPEAGHPSAAPAAPLCPAVSVPMGGAREPLQRVGAAPQHKCTGRDTASSCKQASREGRGFGARCQGPALAKVLASSWGCARIAPAPGMGLCWQQTWVAFPTSPAGQGGKQYCREGPHVPMHGATL